MKKIADIESVIVLVEQRCVDKEHSPPTMIVLEPGVYQHVCPSCGVIYTVIVSSKPTC